MAGARAVPALKRPRPDAENRAMLALVFAVLAGSSAPSSPRPAPSEAAVTLNRVIRRYQTATSYWIRADVTRWDGQEGENPPRETYVVAAAPGGRFRDQGPEETRVCDGSTLHHYVRELGQYSREAAPATQDERALQPLLLSQGFLSLGEILAAHHPRLLRRDSLRVEEENRPVVAMKVTGSLGEAITFWVDARRGVVVRDSVYVDLTGALGTLLPQNRRSAVRVVHDYTTLALGSPVPDSVFAFSPPSAATPVAALDFTAPGQGLEGLPAPDFTLPDLEGRTWTLSALRGRVVLLHFRLLEAALYGGDTDLRLLQDVEKRGLPSGVQALCAWVTVNPEVARDEGRRYGLVHPMLLDELGTVAQAYHAMVGCFVVIGPDGRVRKWLVQPSEPELQRMVAEAAR